jgi:hypothetical protein
MWQDLKSSLSHVDKKETRFRVYLGKSMPSMNNFWPRTSVLSDQPTDPLQQIKNLQTFFSLCIGSKMVINYQKKALPLWTRQGFLKKICEVSGLAILQKRT